MKIALLGPTATVPHYKAGTLRIVAVSSGKRAPYIPDVPTIEEAGITGMILESWYGAFAPKGTPAAIVTRLNAEMAKALVDPAMQGASPRLDGGGRRRAFGFSARRRARIW